MDPHTGQVYSEDEVENLPDKIKKRLVRVPKGQVRRYKERQKSSIKRELKRQYGETPAVVKRRAKNKRAKASRKKNR